MSLAHYAGQSVLFLFFKSGCEPCMEALPHYESARPWAQKAGIELILVSTEDAERTRAFVQERSVSLPILIAPREQNSFQTDYKIPGTPTFCLVDQQGVVQATGFASYGTGDWNKLVARWTTAPQTSTWVLGRH